MTPYQMLESRPEDREPFSVEVGREQIVFVHAYVCQSGAELSTMHMGRDRGEEFAAMYANKLEALAGTLPDGFSGSMSSDEGPPQVTIYRATLRIEAVEVQKSEVAKFVAAWEAEAWSPETLAAREQAKLAGSEARVPDPRLVVDAAGDVSARPVSAVSSSATQNGAHR